jgi:hypothetical protein
MKLLERKCAVSLLVDHFHRWRRRYLRHTENEKNKKFSKKWRKKLTLSGIIEPNCISVGLSVAISENEIN